MFAQDRGRIGIPAKLLALGCGFWALAGTWTHGDDGCVSPPAKVRQSPKPSIKKQSARVQGPTNGTLGYGPPGLHAGFQGFGLGFHPGYGYGGKALGTGSEGGYPFYGGPGYPHPAPCLNRFGHEKPFDHFAGPGYPTPEHPNFFGIGLPLVSDEPVVEVDEGPGEAEIGAGYGNYTGLVPYPEATFAPSTTAIGTAGSAAGVGAPVPPGPALSPPTETSPPAPSPIPPSSSRSSGFEAETTVAPAGAKRLKVTKIQPGGAAEKAGLRIGDEIGSANNFVTEKPADLAWIVDKAAPDHFLRMTVFSRNDGQVQTVNVRLR